MAEEQARPAVLTRPLELRNICLLDLLAIDPRGPRLVGLALSKAARSVVVVFRRGIPPGQTAQPVPYTERLLNCARDFINGVDDVKNWDDLWAGDTKVVNRDQEIANDVYRRFDRGGIDAVSSTWNPHAVPSAGNQVLTLADPAIMKPAWTKTVNPSASGSSAAEALSAAADLGSDHDQRHNKQHENKTYSTTDTKTAAQTGSDEQSTGRKRRRSTGSTQEDVELEMPSAKRRTRHQRASPRDGHHSGDNGNSDRTASANSDPFLRPSQKKAAGATSDRQARNTGNRRRPSPPFEPTPLPDRQNGSSNRRDENLHKHSAKRPAEASPGPREDRSTGPLPDKPPVPQPDESGPRKKGACSSPRAKTAMREGAKDRSTGSPNQQATQQPHSCDKRAHNTRFRRSDQAEKVVPSVSKETSPNQSQNPPPTQGSEIGHKQTKGGRSKQQGKPPSVRTRPSPLPQYNGPTDFQDRVLLQRAADPTGRRIVIGLVRAVDANGATQPVEPGLVATVGADKFGRINYRVLNHDIDGRRARGAGQANSVSWSGLQSRGLVLLGTFRHLTEDEIRDFATRLSSQS